MEFVCPALGIFPTSSTIFDPALISKFIGISNFCLFVIIFGFPNILIVVTLFIIIIYLKFNPSFVTFCSDANLFVIHPSRLVLYWTHSHLRHFPLFDHPLFLLFVLDDCANILSCQTTDILLSYL